MLFVAACGGPPSTPPAAAATSGPVESVRSTSSVPRTANTPSTGSPTTHATVGSLAFGYPSDWTLTPVGNPQRYTTVLAFLVSPTAHAAETCGPDYVPDEGGCSDAYDVPAGAVVVRLSVSGGPPYPGGAKRLIAEAIARGLQPRVVAGQAAAYAESGSGAAGLSSETTLTWRIVGPGSDSQVIYEIQATVGAGAADLRASVETMVASLRITPGAP